MDDSQVALRFELLEAQVKLLSAQLGVPCPQFPGAVAASSTGTPDSVLELARAGKTIQAISELRRLTGATLVEAKRTVETL